MTARTGRPIGRPRGAPDKAPRSRAGWTLEARQAASEHGQRGNARRWATPANAETRERDGYDQEEWA